MPRKKTKSRYTIIYHHRGKTGRDFERVVIARTADEAVAKLRRETPKAVVDRVEKDYIYFFQLYPIDYTFDLPIQISYNMASTKEIDFCIIPDKEQYENYVRRKSFLFTKQYTSTKEIQDTVVIRKGYGIMIRARNDAGMQIEIEFL